MIPFKDRRPFGFPRLNGVARAVHLAIHHGGRLRSIDLVSSDTERSPAVEIIGEHRLHETFRINGESRICIKDVPQRRAQHGALKHKIRKLCRFRFCIANDH